MKLDDCLSFEVACLSCRPQDPEVLFSRDEDVCSVCKELVLQNYQTVLATCLKKLNLGTSPENLSETLKSNYASEDQDSNNQILLFCCGIASLQLFVQNNWTGPVTTKSPTIWEVDDKEARSLLADGVFNISSLVRIPQYLILAKNIFKFLMENSTLQTSCWWYMRSLNVNSQVIFERSDSLFEDIKVALQKSRDLDILTTNKSLAVQLNLESGFSLLHFYQYNQANECFEKTKEITSLSFGFTGALGVRTKFQQKPVAQLIMDVKRGQTDFVSTISEECYKNIPKNLDLNDDTLLEKVKLVNEENHRNADVNPEEAAVILAACNAMQKASPKNRLQEEETATIVDFLLSSPSGWCVYTEALRLRSKNENKRSRTVERSLCQLEELVKFITQESDGGKEYNTRLALFYSVRPPPVWELEKDLARILMSLGCVGTALDIYKRIEMWEDAIMCLIQSDRVSEAIEMCKDQIANNPTPNVLCLFGDLTQNTDYYLRAWELSGQRSTRAMCSLGGYYASKHKYQDAVDCFRKSLKVLSLQVGTWFTMGCSYMSMHEFDQAAESFRRCLSLDWDNFEAWANLSAVYVKSGKKKEAFKSLSEALKCQFDRWELWENYVAISTDVAKFDEAVQAYNRLLDLKKKYEDIPVMKVLVKAAVTDIPDADGRPSSWLKPILFKLFGRITSNMMTSYEMWQLYSQLYASGAPKLRPDQQPENKMTDVERLHRAVEYLHKSLRMGMQTSAWAKDLEVVEKLIDISEELAHLCSREDLEPTKQMLAPVKFSVNNLISKLKQRENELLDEEMCQKFENYREKVEVHRSKVEEIMQNIQS